LLAVGGVLARGDAGGNSGSHRACHPVLALYLERVSVRPHSDVARDPHPYRGNGAVRARARNGMASHERDGRDRARTGADRDAVWPEIRDPRAKDLAPWPMLY